MKAMVTQIKPVRVLATLVALALSSCTNAKNESGPPEGVYWSQDSKLFFVSRSGPTTLSVVGESGFCLTFNRLRDPVVIDQREFLSGYGCKNFDKASEKKWVASYNKEYSHSFTISLISKEKKLGSMASEDLQRYMSLKLYRGCNGSCTKWPEPEFSSRQE